MVDVSLLCVYMCLISMMMYVSICFIGSVVSLSDSQRLNHRMTGPIFLDNVNCIGNESRLAECQHDGINVIGSCYRWTDVGIICRGTIIYM